jgi:alpha-beta hydrolase superfamily lysophospholipase
MFRSEAKTDNALRNGAALAWRTGEAACPVTFAGTVGLYTAAQSGVAPRDTAVLFLSSWGFEEMCTRKLWRLLAERAAGLGVASLRFDYPGTGDALDMAGEQSLETWSQAALHAARTLRRLSGTRRLLLVGHGLGGTLAATLGRELDARGAVLMAPVVSGRFHLRELSAWSKMVDEGLGLRADQRITDHIAVAGLVMPDKVAEGVRGLSLEQLGALPFASALVVERIGREKDAALSARLSALGADVSRMDYAGYDDLVSNPTVARQPLGVIDGVVDWIDRIAEDREQGQGVAEQPGPAVLKGDGFVEEPLRFGDGDRLFGTLCQPGGPRRGATVLLFGTAYDRQAGWARATTEMARHLARNGVASLRFDAANVADSPARPDTPEQVQYSDTQLADARAAMDLLVSRNLGPVLLTGRCSGAYLALRAAIDDERAAGVLPVNIYTFRWDPDMSVDEALRTNPRSLGDYRQRAFDPATFRRLFTGKIDLSRAVGNVALQIFRRLASAAPGTLGRFTRAGRLKAATATDFRTLAERRLPVTLLYSEGDVGLERLRLDFGRDGIERYANVTVETIPDADHNLSPSHAKARYSALLLETALKTG